MSEIAVNDTLVPEKSLKQWLFNPFRFIAGTEALFLGLIVILAAAVIGWFGKTHFDGVLDVHPGMPVPLWVFIAEGVIDWLCMVLFLFISALLISRVSWRFIDILGTQALSRWPTLLTALALLPEANRRFTNSLLKTIQSGALPVINYADALIFGIAMMITLLMIIWMVALMYKSYAVSCNVKGPKAVVTFIISLMLAETLSKVLIVFLLMNASGENIAASDFLPGSAGSTVAVHGFENDPQLVGIWQSVDFVSDVNDFRPGVKLFAEDLNLENIEFRADGTTSLDSTWTRDWIYTHDGRISAPYYLKSIDGRIYLFFPGLAATSPYAKCSPNTTS